MAKTSNEQLQGPRLFHVLPLLLPGVFTFLMLAVGVTAQQAFAEGELWGPGFRELAEPYLLLLALALVAYPLALLYRRQVLQRLWHGWLAQLETPEVLWLVEYALPGDRLHGKIMRRQALLGLTRRGLVLVPYRSLPSPRLSMDQVARVPLECLQTFESPAGGLSSLLGKPQPLRVHLDPSTTEARSRRRRGLEFLTLGSFAARDAFSLGLHRLRELEGRRPQGITE